MFSKFLSDMKIFAEANENLKEDGSIDWNFIDTDMYAGWSAFLPGDLYTEWFDKAAEIIEGKIPVPTFDNEV